MHMTKKSINIRVPKRIAFENFRVYSYIFEVHIESTLKVKKAYR